MAHACLHCVDGLQASEFFRRRAQWLLLFVALGVGLEFLQGWGGARVVDDGYDDEWIGLLVGKKLCRFVWKAGARKLNGLFSLDAEFNGRSSRPSTHPSDRAI